jgi:hypothetical protein
MLRFKSESRFAQDEREEEKADQDGKEAAPAADSAYGSSVSAST